MSHPPIRTRQDQDDSEPAMKLAGSISTRTGYLVVTIIGPCPDIAPIRIEYTFEPDGFLSSPQQVIAIIYSPCLIGIT